VVHHRFRGIVPAAAGITYNFVKWYVPAGLQKHRSNRKSARTRCSGISRAGSC